MRTPEPLADAESILLVDIESLLTIYVRRDRHRQNLISCFCYHSANSMRYLPKDLLGYLPRPIARLISTYIDFDELAFATYFHRTKKTEIEFNSIGIWRWKFQVRSWPSVQIDLKKSYQSTETNTGRFDRKLFLYDIHPDVAIKLIALLDLILHNNDEYLAIDCDCQK